MRRLAVLAVLVLSACASTQHVPTHDYSSPMGSFTCSGFPLGVSVKEARGPHGGTIHLHDGVREFRLDVEEIAPSVDDAWIDANGETLYKGYLAQTIMPLLRGVSHDVQLLEERLVTLTEPDSLKGLTVYRSAVLMSDKNIVRAQLEYSDGKFLYTMSTLARVQRDQSTEQEVNGAYEELFHAFSRCRFPKRW
jgi:hypothetical protein